MAKKSIQFAKGKVTRIMTMIAGSFFLSSCANEIVLTADPAYSGFIGSCYQIHQDMFIHRNACSMLGGENVLSNAASDLCFKETLEQVPAGERINITALHARHIPSWGRCPFVEASLYANDGIETRSQLSLPVCMYRKELSWQPATADYVWEDGDPINFDEKVASPCD